MDNTQKSVFTQGVFMCICDLMTPTHFPMIPVGHEHFSIPKNSCTEHTPSPLEWLSNHLSNEQNSFPQVWISEAVEGHPWESA